MDNGDFVVVKNIEKIKFTGKNFGVMDESATNAGGASSNPIVTYKRDGSTKIFTATNCMVTLSSGNTEMTCRTSEGYGSNHRWTVKFQNSI